MRLTHTCTGSRSPCRLLVVVLVVFLGYLPTEAFPVDRSPKIIRICSKFDWKGDRLVISCQADPGPSDDFALIYWLVNSTFVEMAYPEGRVHDSEQSALKVNGSALIQRDLIFREVYAEDYQTDYTCKLDTPAGNDRRTFRIPRKNSVSEEHEKCKVGREWEKETKNDNR